MVSVLKEQQLQSSSWWWSSLCSAVAADREELSGVEWGASGVFVDDREGTTTTKGECASSIAAFRHHGAASSYLEYYHLGGARHASTVILFVSNKVSYLIFSL